MSMATAEDRQVARPLPVLASLIKERLTMAEAAARPHYEEIAPLLIEARDGHFEGNTRGFYKWAEKTFQKTKTQLMTYMAYGSRAPSKSFKNLEHFVRTKKKEGGLGWQPRTNIRRDWTAPVDDIAERARKEAFRLAQEDELTRAQERDAERKLAHRLIDIGFKVLAKELHPDKLHGDRDAMARLNRVRDKLKHSI